MEILNIIASVLIAILCIWAVLTPRVKTSSPCTCGFFIIFIGACSNVEQPIYKRFIEFPGQLVLNIGLAVVMVVWFYRVEIKGDKMLSLTDLVAIMPYAKVRAATFLEPLNKAMDEFQINSQLRAAAFLGQIGHESGQLRYVKELASGEAYEGRKDLGNTVAGDGVRFKGRGLIQITGRVNYVSCGMALKLDLVNHPDLLEQPVNACRSAAWWWQKHGLNELADAEEYEKITRRINGGANGLEDRVAIYEKAKEVLQNGTS